MSGGTVSYTINIGANISKVKEAMKEVSQLLSSSNLDKGITSSYERKLGKLSNALLELESKASQPIKTDAELRDVERSIRKVTNLTSELGLSFKELQGKDLSKVFGDFTKPVQNLKDYIKEFDKLEKKYNEAESRRNSDRLAYQADRTSKQREIELKKLERQAIVDKEPSRQKGLDDQINKLNAERKALENTRDSLNRDIASPRGTINKFSKNDLLKNLVEADQALLKFKNDYKDLLDKNGILTKSKVKKEDRQNYDFEALRNQYKQLQANRQVALENAKPVLNITQDDDVEKELDKYKTAVEKYKEISEQLNNVREQIAEKKKKTSDLEKDKDHDPTKAIDKEIADLEAAEGKLKKSLDAIDKSTKEGSEKLQKSFNELKSSFKDITKDESFDKLEYSEDNFKKLQEAAKNFSSGQFDKAAKQLQNLGISFENLSDNAGDLKGKVGPVFDEMSRAREMSDDFEHLTWRLKYFFSLAGGFNLMRRAIRSAVTTTKELDAAMTQTAVVSTYTVSDMWKTLPQYSKEASKLGTAIKDVYNAQTLYVQQGLDMNTAMDLGVETMKMARVAGIGAEEATNSMTAALRGFNMAIDEKSAQRINDVYSKLAQNTASNTQEISTAMTKTAALANSANMSFENTAAFLATIIESTREGAETAGTALKTVIARFTEVKQLYTKNQLMGTDEEGQEIDVNKISKALRTAGINMNEFFTGTKGLDEIFKELGSKWNNLSTVQQRYIATQAAGSRQQSRFLALMQNYERTVELTDMAYNSAGSGQEQFEKTLDSLAAKTEQLKNSWDTLLMGLANSEAIKGIVDFGTDILNVINKIIDALSGSSGLTKALATLSIGMGVFKAGRGAFGRGGFFSYLLGGKEISAKVSRTLVGGIVTSLKTAKTTPELGAALGSTISNSFKRNFQLWGQGPNVGGQYLPKDQLEQLKADAEEYQRITNNINRNIRGAESYRENLEAGKVKLTSGLTKEQALEKNQQEISDFNKQKQQVQENFVKEQKEKGFSDSTIKTAMTNPEQIQKATVNYKALGNAVLLAGVGLAGLASYMKNTGKASQEAVASVEALSTGLTTMAMTMKLLQSVGSAVGGLSFLGGPWGMGIAAAVGAIVAIVKVVDALTESAEEKQKRINESISQNQTHIKDLENEYKQVDDSLGSIIEKQDNLNKLTEGTIAWKDAVKELNTEIQTLVQNYPDFLGAVTIGDNGQWTINLEAVRQIQKEKKEEINNSKKFDLALQYTKQLNDLSKITEYSDLGLYSGNKTLAILDEKLKEINYEAISIESINSLIRNSSKNSLKDIIENKDFSWIKEIFGEEDLEEFLSREQVTPELLTYLSQGLQYYKQQSIKNKEITSIIKSGFTSYLIDQFDESLPQDIYGGAFRKFIYSQAAQMAESMVSDVVDNHGAGYEYNHELSYYTDSYYKYQGYKQIGGKWYDLNDNLAEDIDTIELAQFAQIVDLFDELDELTNKFISNPNNFTLGKATLEEYRLMADRGDDFESSLAQYYIGQFEEFINLQKELGTDLGFGENITLNIVSQVSSIIKDTKDNFGKDAALEAADFLKSLYTFLLSDGQLDERTFSGVISGIESGTITNYDQLIEKFDQVFENLGYEFAYEFGGSFESIRKYFTKSKSINSLIEDFSDELSFIDSMRSGKSFYTQEEKDKLLKTGQYREVNFEDQGPAGFKLAIGDSEKIADIYSSFLKNYYTNTISNLEDALSIRSYYDTILKDLRNLPGFELNDAQKALIAGDFSAISDTELLQMLKDSGLTQFYNPNTNEIVDLYDGISTEFLKSTLLSFLQSGDYNEISTQLSVLKKQAKALESPANQMSSDTYTKLADYIAGIKKQRGTQRANSLLDQLLEWNEGEIFTDNIEGVNKFPEFLDAIGKLDWSSINNIEDFQKALSDQGIALDNANGQLEDLFKVFEQIYKLSKIITVDDIKSLTQYGLQLKDEIKNKTDASYTKEQRDYLVNAQKDLIDQFVYNAETGAYTYIGNKQVLEKVAQRAAVTTGYDQLAAQYTVAQGPTTKGYKEALAALGLTEEDIDEIQGYQDDIDFIRQQYYAALELKQYAGLNNDQVRGLGASEKVQKAAAIQDATKQGFSVEDLQRYAEELTNIEGLTEGMAYAIAYDSMLMNKGIDELRSNFSSLKTTIEGIEKDENGNLKLTTPQQLQDLASFNKIIQNITGTTKDFSNQFLTAENTLKLLQRILDGDMSALSEFRKEAAKDLLPKDLSKAPKEFKQLQSAIDNIDLDNVNIGDEIDSGIEGAIDSLLNMGAIGIEQAQAIYEALGFEPPEFEPEIDYKVNTPDLEVEKEEKTGEMTASLQGTGDLAGVSGTATGTITAGYPVLKAGDGGTKGSRKGGSHAKAKAGGSGINSNKSGGGGGGGKEFKNDFDKYYNQVEDINELERQRNLLEKDYNQLLKAENLSGKDIYDNLKKQLQLLEERKKLTADLAEKRKGQLFDVMRDEEYKDVWKYANWNEEDLTIEIDWNAINEIKDSEQGDLVKEYVKKLEDYQSKYDDMINALEEIEDTVQDIKERGKEEYSSLEDRTRDALIKQIQDKIDELTEVDKAITDTNQRLFDSITQTLELQRQERTNAETEEDLTDKEKRLAYLQQDSSNANQLEIAKLQEELDDARQDYTDSLIDQKISELQRQNDEAANQRQQQIDLMQRSLDWQEKSGAFWDEVYRLISLGTDATGELLHGSELELVLQKGENWESLSLEQKDTWADELINQVAQGVAYLEMTRQLEDIGTKEGTQISFTNANGQTLSGTVDKNGNVVVKNADGSTTTYKDVFQDYHGAYRTFEGEGETKVASKPATTTSSTPTKTVSDNKEPQVEVEYSYESAGETSHWIYKRNKGTVKWYRIGMEAHTGVTSCSKCGWKKQNNNSSGGGGGSSNQVMIKYATGGLNTHSGMAWLDGTANAPELVLNARDTENFIELKDTLTSLKSSGGLNFMGGDNYYDIKVQVDSLGSDYDVDKAIDRIKARLAQDGAYRNVNTLSRLR